VSHKCGPLTNRHRPTNAGHTKNTTPSTEDDAAEQVRRILREG
jgi:hypothetical protein